MKSTVATVVIGFIVSLFFINVKDKQPKVEEYNYPQSYTNQEMIEQTDLYWQTVRIEHTLDATNEILEQDAK